MLFTSGNTDFCDTLCSRIAYLYNAKSVRVGMLPHEHANKAGWQKDCENFSNIYLEHISRATTARLAIIEFDKKHAEEVEEYKQKTGSNGIPEAIQKEASVLAGKLNGVKDKDHCELLSKLKSIPNPEVPETTVEEPKCGWNPLTGKSADCVRPCDDECSKIVKTYNNFEARVLALPTDDPEKPELISWCKEYDTKIREHSAECNGIYDKILAARDGMGKSLVEGMTRLALGSMKTSEFDKERKTGKAYVEGLKKQVKELDIDEQHKQLQADFDAGPKIES